MTGAHVLRRFNPDFQSVTFGADGSAQDGSLDWSVGLQGMNGVPTAAHLALCRFAGREQLLSYSATLWQQGIKHLVVLRGDDAGTAGAEFAGFGSVAGAIAALKRQHGFEISISAYPEVHPKALNQKADMDCLLEKLNAGADRAITQFFFDNEDFYRFRDQAERAGFYRELVPGVIPFTNFEKVAGFAVRCGAKLPAHLSARFEEAGPDRSERTKIARDLISEQVSDLARNGVDAIHIYTLNRVDLAADTVRAFRAEFTSLGERAPKLALVG